MLISDYGISKAGGEILFVVCRFAWRVWFHFVLHKFMDTVKILDFLTSFIDHAQKRVAAYCLRFWESHQDSLYVKDAVRAILLALHSDVWGLQHWQRKA